MGCCLTKKSRDNKPGRSAAVGKEPLLQDDRLNSVRGVSLTREPSRNSDVFHTTSSQASYDTASIDGLGTYDPPNHGDGQDVTSRRVVGKSLIEVPELSELDKRTWAYKRGHMVRNWRKRYIVINDGEVLYYEKCDERTKSGINPKGKVHLLGASVTMKLNEEDLPVLEIVGRHGEKDLLLRFDSLDVAQDWYDAIHWTIYKWNVNSLNVDDDSPDIYNWYTQQQVGFEEAYEDLAKGCQFNKHGYNIAGKMTSTICVLQGQREDVSLVWWTVQNAGEGVNSAISSKGKKSLQRRIPLMDIVDVIYGRYTDEDVPMLSVKTNSHTLDLQILDDEASDVFVRSLSTVLVFLAIPVPKNATSVFPTESAPIGRKASSKASRRT